MVNHNGSGWALYFGAPSFSYPALISPLSQPMVSKVNVTHMHPKTPSTEWKPLFGCLTKSLYWHRYSFSPQSLIRSVVLQRVLGSNTEHRVAAFSRVLNRELISLSARWMQTVNRESKQLDVNPLCCNQYSGLNHRRNNPMKCQHILFEAFMLCIAGSPSTLFLLKYYSVISNLCFFLFYLLQCSFMESLTQVRKLCTCY